MQRIERDDYVALLWGEVLLLGLLGASLALFLAYPSLPTVYELPELSLVIDTAITLAASVVGLLAGVRFSVEGRRLDLLLSCGFFVAAATTLLFAIVPEIADGSAGPAEQWAEVGGLLVASSLIAAAPFVRGRISRRERALGTAIASCAIVLLAVWVLLRTLGTALPPPGEALGAEGPLLVVALGAHALLNLVATVGFGVRFRNRGQDLDRWLCLGTTLMLFASLHFVFTPLENGDWVSQGDFLRVLSYGVLLVGVWRAIRHAESGRAVAEERARVAREIHDGLAQYLFAVSTHASMLETAADPRAPIASLKEAAALAQQEARFAVLALSSASGTAPFDAALRRYVELLTADGALEVELEIDAAITLAPDEQIEVFRIVQEGLANVRKHAEARRAEVLIGRRERQRFVVIRDDGAGFESEHEGAGQGLKNMRARAESIGGAFAISSHAGRGTAVELMLRV